MRSAITAAGTAAAMPALQSLNLLGANGRVQAAAGEGGYGPLVPTQDLRDGVARIALPEGFQYRTFSPAGAMMSDGNRVPLAHDGMAVFNMPEGRFRLVRNHEDRNAPGAGSTAIDGHAYDPKGGGGTTTLVINPFTRQLERDFISLNGTTVNCAGGTTPWGSWITCEETNVGLSSGWAMQHGYCFEVPASANGSVPALPIPDMGRFAHEALATDPGTGIIYETEDNGGNSGFYRFIPDTPGDLQKGGTLQMLAIDGKPNYDTRTGQKVGAHLPVKWVDIANPNPPGTTSTAVFSQGFALGGARFARLEGCCWSPRSTPPFALRHGAVYFNATNGGNAGRGQVWEYRPQSGEDRLTLIFESAGADQLDFPDNLTVSPRGALLLCEDGDGDQYLRGVTVDGRIFDFALNLQNDSEWAGATFAVADPRWNDAEIRGADPTLGGIWKRTTLFVNRQGTTSGPNPPAAGSEGLTFAIWGPWFDGAL